MFVGKRCYLQTSSALFLNRSTGAAIGNLGQHTEVKNGLPVFDHRLTVFEQVNSTRIMSTYEVQDENRLSSHHYSPKH